MDVSYPHYANIVQLKEKFPTLKIFLSVGGNEDEKDPEKYLLLVKNFIINKFPSHYLNI